MRRPRLAALATALAVVCLVPAGAVLRGDQALIQVGTAFVSVTDDGQGWTIGNELIRYALAFDGQAVSPQGILDAQSGRAWLRPSGPDSFVVVNGQRVIIGSAATIFQGAHVTEWWGGVRLDLTYRLTSVPMDITRSYACYAGSSVIETWTTFQPLGSRPAMLSDITDYAFAVPNGNLRWVTGFATPKTAGGPFTAAQGLLDDGQTFELGADKRASEHVVPFFGVQASGAQFFGSILWNGSWRFKAHRQGDDINVQLGLPTFTTTVAAGASLEAPHAIFGFTNETVPEVSIAIRGFVDKALRHGRPIAPYVTYNTWYSYGTFIDQASLLAEMDLAAALGVEQFVVDAGWWFHIDPDNPDDFARDWGYWQVDPERFPSGLGFLSDHAHTLGMRFGVWAEPERVDRRTVGLPGLAQEPFLATTGTGDQTRYDPSAPDSQSTSAQICLADPSAREWLFGKLIQFLDDAHPDYLKWDNNFWVNCARIGHGHGTEDGNFAHVRGLQQLLDALRNRYPKLDIENSASGGNRLSLDSLVYTDAAWMDDQTSPSSRVRHNLEGLAAIFPSAYLMSFAISTTPEPMADDPQFDLPNLMRSRMPGAVGMSVPIGDMSPGTQQALANEVALYKLIRPIIAEGSALLLSPQWVEYPDQPWSGWDVVEHVLPRTGEAVVFAFNSPDVSGTLLVKPKALRPAAMYDVESADYGALGTASGADLVNRGIEVPASSISHGHVLIFRIHRGR